DPAVRASDRVRREAERPELREKLQRTLAVLVPPGCLRDDPRPYEIADGVPDEELIVPIRKVQMLSAPRSGSFGPPGSSAGARPPCAGLPRARPGRRCTPPRAFS